MEPTSSLPSSRPELSYSPVPSIDQLIGHFLDAFDAGPRETAPERMAEALRLYTSAEPAWLPESHRRPGEKSYARRLLHFDEERQLMVLVMAWGPGQGATIHDHGGFWCIEQVLQGELEADLYRSLGEREQDGAVQLQWMARERQRKGALAVLRPPVEHHSIRNPSAEETAVTLHVYGGNLTRCTVFQPLEGDWYTTVERQLSYTD